MSYNVGAFCLIKLNCLHYISEDFYIFFLYNNIVSYHNLIIDKNISRLLSKIYSKDTFKLIISYIFDSCLFLIVIIRNNIKKIIYNSNNSYIMFINTKVDECFV